MEPDLRRTSRGEPRGTSPDGIDAENVYLIKNVPLMRLTYQVSLLSAAAEQNALGLVIVLPHDAQVSGDLGEFAAARPWVEIRRQR